MLHVTRLTDRRGSYYTTDLATELGRPSVGRWLGEGAAGLGLGRWVAPADLVAILSGTNPRSGRALVTRNGPVSGFDLTFTAPKSVSILMALGPTPVGTEVLESHQAAVEGAMGYLATHGVGVRRGNGLDREVYPVEGLVGASFTHGLSRSLDPHLHSHVVVANLGHGPDGRWTAIDGRGVYAHAKAAGRLCDAVLRHELTLRIGAGWTPRRSGSYEVGGVGPEAIGLFSSRQAEIRSTLAGADQPGRHRPRSSRSASRIAWAETRDPKPSRLTPTLLVGRWSQMARDADLPVDLAEPRTRRAPTPEPVDEHRFAAALVTGPHVAVARRDVVAAWAGALAPGATVTDVNGCVDRLARWDDGVGVAEARRAPAGLVPGPVHVRALGARPGSPELLVHWQRGAAAVDRYLRTWEPTGHRPDLSRTAPADELAAMPARKLAEFLTTRRVVNEVGQRLGRSAGRDLEPTNLSLGRA